MKVLFFLTLIVLFSIFTACSSVNSVFKADQTSTSIAVPNIPEAKFVSVEEMGFLGFDLKGEAKEDDRFLATAKVGNVSVSDTLTVYIETVIPDEQINAAGSMTIERWKQLIAEKGQKVLTGSVYGPDITIRYLDKAGVKYKLPLGRQDLEDFAGKASWTLSKL